LTPYPKRKSTDVPSSSVGGMFRVRVTPMASPRVLASDAVLDLLAPLWQVVIGVMVLVTLVFSVYRLFMRGPSRMGGALLLVGGAVVCLAVVSYLVQSLTQG
jgi:hypothetical protein